MNINGADFYYELHGQGTPLVLIAGYTCDHTIWSAMLDELTARFQVLLLDNRGVGQTRDKGAFFTLETMAEDTMALVQQLGLVRPHILGHSMGGAIAQIIARKYPDNINKLIILNSVAKLNIRTMKAVEALLTLRKEDISFDLLVDLNMPWFCSSGYLANPENIEAFKSLKNNPYLQTIQDQERQFRAIQQFDASDWLHQIKAPTLVIAAEEDIVDLPAESQQLAAGIENAQYVLIPGGHMSPIEQPKEVNKAILKFLS